MGEDSLSRGTSMSTPRERSSWMTDWLMSRMVTPEAASCPMIPARRPSRSVPEIWMRMISRIFFTCAGGSTCGWRPIPAPRPGWRPRLQAFQGVLDDDADLPHGHHVQPRGQQAGQIGQGVAVAGLDQAALHLAQNGVGQPGVHVALAARPFEPRAPAGLDELPRALSQSSQVLVFLGAAGPAQGQHEAAGDQGRQQDLAARVPGGRRRCRARALPGT
jgi:hypothetical protein